MKRKIALATALFLGLLGPTLGTGVTPASASGTVRLCGARTDGSLGYCLNDWGGHDFSGDPVKMDSGGLSNENFWVSHLTATCGGAGYVTSNSSCYGQWGTQGGLLVGSDIIAIVYGPGGCLGSDSTGKAIIANCPGSDGTGGGTGTVFAMSVCGPFGQPQEDCITSRPWSHSSGQIANLESGGNIGIQAGMTCTGGCTVWGGTGAPEQ